MACHLVLMRILVGHDAWGVEGQSSYLLVNRRTSLATRLRLHTDCDSGHTTDRPVCNQDDRCRADALARPRLSHVIRHDSDDDSHDRKRLSSTHWRPSSPLADGLDSSAVCRLVADRLRRLVVISRIPLWRNLDRGDRAYGICCRRFVVIDCQRHSSPKFCLGRLDTDHHRISVVTDLVR